LDIIFIIFGVGAFVFFVLCLHKRHADAPQTHGSDNRQRPIAEDEINNLRDTNNPAPFS